jgi:hypothetical protein
MFKFKWGYLLLLASIMSYDSYAGSVKSMIFKSDNSGCRVESSGEEYADYKVIKGKKIIFIKTETASNIIFSSDGTYIAIGDTNISPVTLDNMNYHLAIINCNTEKSKGYLKLFEDTKIDKDGWNKTIEYASPLSFESNGKVLKYEANLISSKKGNKSKEQKITFSLKFDKTNYLP